MNQLFFIADYIKGRPIYPQARRVLNLLFNVSIASFLFEKYYGHYSWIDIQNYKAILDFFIKGKFFIPFSIFIVVCAITQLFAELLFFVFTFSKRFKITDRIIRYELKKESFDVDLNIFKGNSKEILIKLYESIKSKIDPHLFDKLKADFNKAQNDVKYTFTLCLRGFFAVTVYFFLLPQFGWILFALVSVILVISLFVLTIAYRFLDVLPALIGKLSLTAEQIYKALKEGNN